MEYLGPTQCADPIKLFRQDQSVVSQLKTVFDNCQEAVIVSSHVPATWLKPWERPNRRRRRRTSGRSLNLLRDLFVQPYDFFFLTTCKSIGVVRGQHLESILGTCTDSHIRFLGCMRCSSRTHPRA